MRPSRSTRGSARLCRIAPTSPTKSQRRRRSSRRHRETARPGQPDRQRHAGEDHPRRPHHPRRRPDRLDQQLASTSRALSVTVENTPKLAPDGTANPDFKGGNFGFAWYQSDLHSNHRGEGETTIKTILLDQIFGFDAGRGVPPVNTFNVGFWFNNPADAANCGFTGFTPFNGEHHAGPLAMISGVDATTRLGPLCTDPQSNGDGTFHCNP